ncbi:MAG TPA: hypothetical protein VMA36_09865 [Candidatus Limnocylindria bacterium]|nr:hypothetical protein [Candidatus Limnocylindria bacterium]
MLSNLVRPLALVALLVLAPHTAFAQSTAQVEAPAAASVLVPAGTPLKIALTDQLASNSAHSGDKFGFHALDDITVDGWIVIPKGALGEGEVVHAESAGGNGHPGKLQLQFDWIYDANDLKVRLSDVPATNDGAGAKGAASTATIASYVLLGPLGLFAHNFVHGKDVIVKRDQKIEVYVAQAVHVTPKDKVSATDGFAH